MEPDPSVLILRMTQAFDQLGIPYMIGGSIASAIHGISRATHDVDFVADIRPEQAQSLVNILGEDFYADEETIRDAAERRDMFSVIFLPTMYKADVFLLKPTSWAQQEWARRYVAEVELDEETHAIHVASAEDMVLQKLEWYRMGGGVSDRQWEDVLGILKVQAEALDYDYMRRWAAALGLRGLLDRALDDAGGAGA